MKLMRYYLNQDPFKTVRFGCFVGNQNDKNAKVIDFNLCWQMYYLKKGFYNYQERALQKMPNSIIEFLKYSDDPLNELKETLNMFKKFEKKGDLILTNSSSICIETNMKSIVTLSPLDEPTSYRDFYAFEKHVKKGFEKRNEPVPKEWYEMPVYYKGATSGFIGHLDDVVYPAYSNKLDYELELGFVIGKDGQNIKAKNAWSHILGYTILNDFSARDTQKKEMAVRLGPAKGKDFCTALGPFIVTRDEFGDKMPNLNMKAFVNNKLWSEGKSGSIHFDFAQMIEHVSKEEWVRAGDLMGSGTVGTGCGLELDKWIKSGDKIKLEIDKIGYLTNKIAHKKE
jgi:2-keto-4-pentenoate hydratase/2-oxohepta-3-ene-1,7-dioic acid hydratase in catechol pathway